MTACRRPNSVRGQGHAAIVQAGGCASHQVETASAARPEPRPALSSRARSRLCANAGGHPSTRTRSRATLAIMTGSSMSLADDASALLAAARRLEADAGEPGSAVLVADSLGEVEEALRALDRACGRAAQTLVPTGAIDERVSLRYARAAANWPVRGDAAPPSYERQAQVLASLHDAGATLRAGAEYCRRARAILASTVAAPDASSASLAGVGEASAT